MTTKKTVGVAKTKKVITKEEGEEKLNLQQESFCKLYALGDKEVFGNGTLCYLQTYGAEHLLKYKTVMTHKVAGVNASRLLGNARIIARINALLEEGGFNDVNVDKQHLFLVNQFSDLKTKLGAIREYNELKKRINNKVDLSVSFKPTEETMDLRRNLIESLLA